MPAEVRYPVVERELLAVIYAMQTLRRYLLDKTFILFKDNTAVRYLFAKADLNIRLQRWVLATQEFSCIMCFSTFLYFSCFPFVSLFVNIHLIDCFFAYWSWIASAKVSHVVYVWYNA